MVGNYKERAGFKLAKYTTLGTLMLFKELHVEITPLRVQFPSATARYTKKSHRQDDFSLSCLVEAVGI
jgi:hypothetical protein